MRSNTLHDPRISSKSTRQLSASKSLSSASSSLTIDLQLFFDVPADFWQKCLQNVNHNTLAPARLIAIDCHTNPHNSIHNIKISEYQT